MSRNEWRLWYRLRKRQLMGASFRRQVPIGPYFADLGVSFWIERVRGTDLRIVAAHFFVNDLRNSSRERLLRFGVRSLLCAVAGASRALFGEWAFAHTGAGFADMARDLAVG